MKALKHLFDNNKEWASDLNKKVPGIFRQLSHQQTPEYLWIGCSDSRVPANEIVGLMPGELFVHRNVANLVLHTDLNCLSVMQFAVDILKVKHIIVCGHYGCGGVKAVLENSQLGLVNNWLRHIQEIRKKYNAEISSITDKKKQFQRLCELNVKEQVLNVCNTTIVQHAWLSEQPLTVHGWIYDISDGLLQDLDVCISSNKELMEKFK